LLPASTEDVFGAFAESGVRRIEIEKGNPFLRVRGDFVESFNGVFLVHYFGTASKLAIPAYITLIHGWAFYGCESIRQVTFNRSARPLLELAIHSFGNCRALQSICIPSLVPDLRAASFSGCSSLRSVTFEPGSQLRSIEGTVFQACEMLEAIDLPSTLETIGEMTFSECSRLARIGFSQNSHLLRIEKAAFSKCTSLQSIEIPASVEYIGENCFAHCFSLAALTFLPPPHVRELLDLPPQLPGSTEIPDCVECLGFCGPADQGCQHTLVFGAESKLETVKPPDDDQVDRQSFVRVSSRSLKRFRLSLEFTVCDSRSDND
jgi:hypothetical protein